MLVVFAVIRVAEAQPCTHINLIRKDPELALYNPFQLRYTFRYYCDEYIEEKKIGIFAGNLENDIRSDQEAVRHIRHFRIEKGIAWGMFFTGIGCFSAGIVQAATDNKTTSAPPPLFFAGLVMFGLGLIPNELCKFEIPAAVDIFNRNRSPRHRSP
jgi:hypothetical protein